MSPRRNGTIAWPSEEHSASLDIVPHLPPDVAGSMRSRIGGMNQNLSALLLCMSKLLYPPLLIKVDKALGHLWGEGS